MPLISINLNYRDKLEKQTRLLEELRLKCLQKQTTFQGSKPDSEFIYEVTIYLPTTINAILAVANYGKTYVLITPDDITEDQLRIVFSKILQDADPDEQFVVFLQRDYEAIKKYSPNENISVTYYS